MPALRQAQDETNITPHAPLSLRGDAESAPIPTHIQGNPPLNPLQGGDSLDIYSGMKQWQRDVFTARLVILREIDNYCAQTGRSINKAIKAFLEAVSNAPDSRCPAHLKKATEVANHRRGKDSGQAGMTRGRFLSWQTIYRWIQIRAAEGDIGLVPADPSTLRQAQGDIPLWAAAFLDIYRQPQKRSIADCLRDMGPEAPNYHSVIRFLKKFSNIDILKGRMSGSELRAHKAYIKRDFSGLLPCDIYVCDGHSFKAYVAHPAHGKRFLPEVEAVIDVATRACVGWSTGLSESGQVVADALRHAVTTLIPSQEGTLKKMGGLFAIVYADNGPGNRAKMNSHEVTGIVARCGGTSKFGIAGNPQGRGVIERLNESLWLPSAKKLLTYNGKDMDALSQRRTLKIIDKDMKEHGASRMLPSWPQFIEFLAGEVAAYNNREHSSLPRIVDASGRRRHMTPAERWASFMAEGFRSDTLTDEEMRDLFRPQVQCITRRGLVTVFGNEYFNAELEHHNGETVFVNYDIHDWKVVWVRDRQQRLICEAAWGGNRRAFYPISVVEQAREKRKERRLALKWDQIAEIEAEARGTIETERIPPEAIQINAVIPAEAGIHGNMDARLQSSGMTEKTSGDNAPPPTRPLFPDNIARYEWHLTRGTETEADERWVAEFKTTSEYEMLYGEGKSPAYGGANFGI